MALVMREGGSKIDEVTYIYMCVCAKVGWTVIINVHSYIQSS